MRENSLTRNKVILFGHIVLPPQLIAEVKARLHPLHAEIKSKGDGVVLVINAKHIRDFKTCKYLNEIVSQGAILGIQEHLYT